MPRRLKAGERLAPHYGTKVYYTSRNVEYQFEWYEDREDEGHWGAAVVVYAVRPDHTVAWSASTTFDRRDRVVDVVRAARANA